LSDEFYPPVYPPRPPERPWREPPTFPPFVAPTDDVARLLRRILDRLDSIERRLDRIERLLQGRSQGP